MCRSLHSLHQVRLGVVQDHKSLAEATSVTGVPFFSDWNSAIISVFPDVGSSYDASVNLADSYSVNLMYTSNIVYRFCSSNDAAAAGTLALRPRPPTSLLSSAASA